jgi:hypothetical protein
VVLKRDLKRVFRTNKEEAMSRSRSSTGSVRISRLAVFFALFTSPALAQTPAGISGVLAPGVAPELVQGGFTALEGPVGAADGTVYFSDRMPDRTYHLGLDGKITVYRRIPAPPTALRSPATATW